MQLLKYTEEWANIFLLEKAFLENILEDSVEEIHHIGSTSIQGMFSKPIIDILVIVKSLHKIKNLSTIGYKFKGDLNIPKRLYFSKNGDLKYHLHLVKKEHPFIRLNLMFRDFLKANLEWKNKYIDLKKELIKNETIFSKPGNNFTYYALAKNEFIKNILQKAGFSEYIINIPIHLSEQKYINKHIQNIENFKNKFVLYKGIDIVGCAAIENEFEVITYIEEEHLSKKKFLEEFIKKYIRQENPHV